MSRLRNTRRPFVPRPRTLRRTLVLAILALVWSALLASSVAYAASVVVYDAIGPTLVSNPISVSFGAAQVNEFGDLVTLAPGGRDLTKVSVALSSQACQSGSGTPTCTTTPGATFNHPLTMTLYNAAGTPAAPTVGTAITKLTATFTIPFRPSADPVNCVGANAGRWFNGSICQTGQPLIVDFVFPTGTTLPDTLIWGISYNTNTAGYAPIGAPGPYDFLNVGSLTVNPTVGTDVNEDMAFISSAATAGAFVSELGWTGNRPMARISVQAPPAPPTTVAAVPPSVTTPTVTPTTSPVAAPTGVATTPTASLPQTGAQGLPATLAIGVGLCITGSLLRGTRRRRRRP